MQLRSWKIFCIVTLFHDTQLMTSQNPVVHTFLFSLHYLYPLQVQLDASKASQESVLPAWDMQQRCYALLNSKVGSFTVSLLCNDFVKSHCMCGVTQKYVVPLYAQNQSIVWTFSKLCSHGASTLLCNISLLSGWYVSLIISKDPRENIFGKWTPTLWNQLVIAICFISQRFFPLPIAPKCFLLLIASSKIILSSNWSTGCFF